MIEYLKKYNKAPSYDEWTNEILTFNKTRGNEYRCNAIYERGKKQGQRCRAATQIGSIYCKIHENYKPSIDINELVKKINNIDEKLNTLTPNNKN